MFSTFDLCLLLYVIRLAGWLKHCNLSLSLSGCTGADLTGTPHRHTTYAWCTLARLLDTDLTGIRGGGRRHMEFLRDKFDQVVFVRSFQARSAPLPAAASWCSRCSRQVLKVGAC